MKGRDPAWQNVQIGHVCDLIVDCVNKTAPTVDGPTPYKMIRTTNVRNGWVDTEAVNYVDEATFRMWSRRGRPLRGDVILTREAPLGEVGMLRSDDQIFLGQRLVMYRANPQLLDPHFLLYSMLAPYVQGQIRSMGSGATVEHMRVPDCSKWRMWLPSLPTQRRIAFTLTAYDDLIENNTRRIRILEEMVQAIYREWFVEFRFPGHEDVRMVESELGQIPDGWSVSPFTQLADVILGGTPSTGNTTFWGGEIPFFTPRDATDSLCVLDTERHITAAGLAACRSEMFPAGTTFVTARGTVGKVVSPAVPMALNQSCYAMVGRDGVSQDFLLYLLKNKADYLRANTGGATFDTIVMDTFRRMHVVCPPFALISAFGSLARPLRELEVALLRAKANLSATRDLLLPRLISGEIDVSDFDTGDAEPAA